MTYIKLQDGVVIQKQSYAEAGFVEVSDDVVCGQIDNGDGTFSNPPVPQDVLKERQRIDLKRQRDDALNAIVHDFGDGRVIQVRPQDVANLQLAISLNVNQEWVMADNTVALLTPAEMQAALDGGVMQGQQILQNYIDDIKAITW